MHIFLTVGNAELDTKLGTLSRKWTGTGSWLLGRKMDPMFVVFWSQSSQHCRVSGFVQLYFQCPCFQCSIWQLCMPGANGDRVSQRKFNFFVHTEKLSGHPSTPLLFSYLSPPLSFPHLNFSVLSLFFIVALYCDWIFPPFSSVSLNWNIK